MTVKNKESLENNDGNDHVVDDGDYDDHDDDDDGGGWLVGWLVD